MPTYVVATMAIHDPETYRKYTVLTPALVKRHGGKFLTRGDEVFTLEGSSYEDRMVILEFPSKADAEALFKNDQDYIEAAKFRHAASVGRMLMQEGRPNTENPDPKV